MNWDFFAGYMFGVLVMSVLMSVVLRWYWRKP